MVKTEREIIRQIEMMDKEMRQTETEKEERMREQEQKNNKDRQRNIPLLCLKPHGDVMAHFMSFTSVLREQSCQQVDSQLVDTQLVP